MFLLSSLKSFTNRDAFFPSDMFLKIEVWGDKGDMEVGHNNQ